MTPQLHTASQPGGSIISADESGSKPSLSAAKGLLPELDAVNMSATLSVENRETPLTCCIWIRIRLVSELRPTPPHRIVNNAAAESASHVQVEIPSPILTLINPLTAP